MCTGEIPFIDQTTLRHTASLSDHDVEFYKSNNNQVVCIKLMLDGNPVDRFYKVNYKFGEGELRLHKIYSTFHLLIEQTQKCDASPCYEVSFINSQRRAFELNSPCLPRSLQEAIEEPILICDIQDRIESKHKLNQTLYKTISTVKTAADYKAKRVEILKQLEVTEHCLTGYSVIALIRLFVNHEPEQIPNVLKLVNNEEGLEDSIKLEVQQLPWNKDVILSSTQVLKPKLSPSGSELAFAHLNYIEPLSQQEDSKPLPWKQRIEKLQQDYEYDKKLVFPKVEKQISEAIKAEETKIEINLDLKEQAEILLNKHKAYISENFNRDFMQISNILVSSFKLQLKIKALASIIEESDKKILELKNRLDKLCAYSGVDYLPNAF